MSLQRPWLLLLLLAASPIARAQVPIYTPFGSWVDPQFNATMRWRAQLTSVSDGLGVKAGTAGRWRIGPQSTKLLAGYFLQKHPKLLQNSPARAQELILRRYARAPGPLRGYMAEALFVERNPEWDFVARSNAPQHDVTRLIPGRRAPFNGQIKYHDSGEPALYARDMVKDYRAHRFFIPDDHVESTRAYLRRGAERAQARGDAVEARRLWRDYGRVRPMRASSAEVRLSTEESARYLERQRRSGLYTALGVAIALSVAPAFYELATGRTTANVAAYKVARAVSLTGVGLGTDYALGLLARGVHRGVWFRGSMVGGAMAITEVAWLVYEHGGRQAFYQPEFYEEAVGGMSAVGLGVAAGTVAAGVTAETGMLAVVIGTAAGAAAGIVGYVGGRAAAYYLIGLLKPEMLRQREVEQIQFAKGQIDRSIATLQRL